ncbi:MAG TPA: AI-2E family transporter, partial [Syntrophomonadaceae bacterium]|nr:AI-2E family transporter [Syntrophomonadaceae bacterium]
VSAKTALYMLIAILIIQQIESAIVTPNVMGGKLGMHPLVIVFVLLTGAQLFGIWGMLLAVPVTAVLRVLLIWIHLRLVG